MKNNTIILGFSLLALVTPCSAQIIKCTVQGKIVYQEIPCDGGQKVNISGAGTADTTSSQSIKVRRDVADLARRNRISEAIGDRKILVGMTSEEVIQAWGKPSKINQSISRTGTSEQWVYERESISNSQYLYLDNGVVRSMQSSK